MNLATHARAPLRRCVLCSGCAVLLAALLAACRPPIVRPEPLKTFAAAEETTSPSDPWTGRKDLITPPPVQPAAPLHLPPLSRSKLGSGLSLLVVPDRRLPLIDVLLLFPTGGIHDPPDKVGLASFTARMLRYGARGLGADAIAERVESAGASLAVRSSYEFSSIACRGRSSALQTCLRTVAEIARWPRFPKEEMPEVLAKLTQEVRYARDDPAELASQHFFNMLYGDDHPGGRPMTVSSLGRIARDDLVRFHRDRYSASSALLVIAGDIDVQDVNRRAEKLLGGWRTRGTAPAPLKPVSDPAPGMHVLLVDKPDLSQSFFTLGHAGISVRHPHRDAVRVMNYVLGGGGFSSRLMQVLRAQGGKTYGVHSSFLSATDDGAFSVETFTRNAEIATTLALVHKELRRIRSDPPTAAEINAAQGKIAGGYSIRFKTGTDIALALAEAELRGLPETQVTELAVRVGRLTPSEIAVAASAHIRPERLVAAVVGRAETVAPLLRKAGIPFSQISYLDPISARARAARRDRTRASAASIPPAERARARRLLARAVRVAGGAQRIAAIKTLRLSGSARRGKESTPYRMIVIPPDQLRVAMVIGKMHMLISVTRKEGFAEISGSPRKPLPAAKLAALRAEISRQPPLVLHAALRAERSRIVEIAGLAKGFSAVQTWLGGDLPTTLVLDRSYRLVQLRYLDSRGMERLTELGDHRRVAGVLVPHRVSSTRDGKSQVVSYEKVEVNPAIAPLDAPAGPAPPARKANPEAPDARPAPTEHGS